MSHPFTLTEPLPSIRMEAEKQLRKLSETTLARPMPSFRAEGFTIDITTVRARDRNAEQKIRRFCWEHNFECHDLQELPWEDFTNWLIARSAVVKPRTYRNDRNDIVDYLEFVDESAKQIPVG